MQPYEMCTLSWEGANKLVITPQQSGQCIKGPH